MSVAKPRLALPVLSAGHNCWRVEPVRRLAFLVDGQDCFRAMRSAFVQAQHSTDVLAWDIDSRMRLCPDGARDDLPQELGPFFDALTRGRPSLRVRLLSWDFAMLYAWEREWLQRIKLGRRTHPRVEFALDARHPLGASHHQKLVVVDDSVAFVGGFDLTRARWDTPQHSVDDPRRHDADGTPYRPFHDVHVVVEGTIARALGEVARARWFDAVGERCAPPPARRFPAWPAGVKPDLANTHAGIARTAPAFAGRAAIGEIRTLLLDAVANASTSIYADAQYFTAESFSDALRRRLREAHGPEFVLVTSPTQSGWLQEKTMGALRARLDAELREADVHDRYRAFYPHQPGLDGCINVHSKLLTFDDRLLVIGSANLNNRSMGLDTEICLVLDAALDRRIAPGIAALRNRLLAEHLDRDPAEVAAAVAARGGLIGAIEALSDNGRSLREPQFGDHGADAAPPLPMIVDPEEPLQAAETVLEVAAERRATLRRRVLWSIGFAVVLGTLAVLWLGTPLREWADVPRLVDAAHRLGDSRLAPIAVLGAFVAGGFVVAPVNVLIAATVIVFGPLVGALYALLGSLLSAFVLHEVGRLLPLARLRERLDKPLRMLTGRMPKHSIIAIMLVRIIPVAPYSVVNVISGAAHVERLPYLIGTALGMLPGIVLNALLIDRLIDAIEHPGPWTWTLLALVGVLIVGLVAALRRRLQRAAASHD